MILLLDAHALLWWLGQSSALAAPARGSIADPRNDVLVSTATIWELEIKRGLGKLRLADGLLDAIGAVGFSCLPILPDDATRAARLPLHHRDPFDRMLVAQAQRLDALIVSRDPAFDAYEVDVLPA